jgi:hypothetical protein
MEQPNVSEIPYIKNLDAFAGKLPSEFRAELYTHVICFLELGITLANVTTSRNMALLFTSSFGGEKKKSDNSEFNDKQLLMDYLKQQEEKYNLAE